MNFLPTHHVRPLSQPYVREISYVNDYGPPPVEFFDRTQDHLIQMYHALLGWQWSRDKEDFVLTTERLGSTTHMASFSIVRNEPLGAGLALSNMVTAGQGEHGVVRGSAVSAIDPYFFEVQNGAWRIGTEDYLITAKVYCVRRSVIDPVDRGGFWIGAGPPLGADGNFYPGLVGGSGHANWHAWVKHDDDTLARFYDTGIPFLTSEEMPDQTRRAWNTIHIGRENGTVRFWINGVLAKLTNFNLVAKPGVRNTASLRDMRCYFKTNRSGGGSTSDGFYMDYFTRWARRPS